jgi:hypothetical protein
MKNVTVHYVLIWCLALVATATGVIHQGEGGHVASVTARGEPATLQGHGLYRYDPASVAREGIIWDAINLFVGLPLFGGAVYLARRNSLRGRLLLSGLLFYFFYVYLMYATMVAFNPLFLVYVAIFALCGVGFFLNLSRIDVAGLPARMSPRFPRRLFTVYSIALSVMLVLLWSKLVASILTSGRFPPDIAGMNTLQTQALDLGLVVPLALASAVLLARRSPWGYLLTGVIVAFGLMMCITIPTWIAVALIEQGTINPVEAVPFLVLCLVGLVLAGLFHRNVQEGAAQKG